MDKCSLESAAMLSLDNSVDASLDLRSVSLVLCVSNHRFILLTSFSPTPPVSEWPEWGRVCPEGEGVSKERNSAPFKVAQSTLSPALCV